MKYRIVCSVIILAMSTCMVRAQAQTPAKETPMPMPQTIDKMPDLTNTPTISGEPIVTSGMSIYPEPYRPFAWVSGGYTFSWMSRPNVAALVTSSPPGTAQADAGVLGRNSTNVLLGEGSLGSWSANGVRLSTGISVCDGMTFEVAGFYMRTNSNDFSAGGDGSANSNAIARPFFEPFTLSEANQLVAFPGRFAGTIDVTTRTTLWGIEGNLFEKFDLGCPIHLGLGFRYAQLNDSLQIQQNTRAIGNPPLTFAGFTIPLSDSVQINDSFRTQNQFIGPQLNVRYQETLGSFTLEVVGKVAMGSNQQNIYIAGHTSHLGANGQVIGDANGGFLALPSNIGTFTSNGFGVIPEVNLKLGYNITHHLNVFVAYDFLAWTNIARAGDQIDRTVNLTQVPTAAIFNPTFGGPNSPFPTFHSADLTIHSIRVGVEWKF